MAVNSRSALTDGFRFCGVDLGTFSMAALDKDIVARIAEVIVAKPTSSAAWAQCLALLGVHAAVAPLLWTEMGTETETETGADCSRSVRDQVLVRLYQALAAYAPATLAETSLGSASGDGAVQVTRSLQVILLHMLGLLMRLTVPERLRFDYERRAADRTFDVGQLNVSEDILCLGLPTTYCFSDSFLLEDYEQVVQVKAAGDRLWAATQLLCDVVADEVVKLCRARVGEGGDFLTWILPRLAFLRVCTPADTGRSSLVRTRSTRVVCRALFKFMKSASVRSALCSASVPASVCTGQFPRAPQPEPKEGGFVVMVKVAATSRSKVG